MEKLYGREPKVIGCHTPKIEELMFFQDMPIKMSGSSKTTYEGRLRPFTQLIQAATRDFIRDFGELEFRSRYIYISAKNLYQSGTSYNRSGWHCDGFGGSDINYIWSNAQPTVFNFSEFDLPEDDISSMFAMEDQADPANDFTYPDGTLVRLDQYVVHKVNPEPYVGVRAFLKVSFSLDRFDLIGNAKNPLLNYDWKMRPRGEVRNIPQSQQSK